MYLYDNIYTNLHNTPSCSSFPPKWKEGSILSTRAIGQVRVRTCTQHRIESFPRRHGADLRSYVRVCLSTSNYTVSLETVRGGVALQVSNGCILRTWIVYGTCIVRSINPRPRVGRRTNGNWNWELTEVKAVALRCPEAWCPRGPPSAPGSRFSFGGCESCSALCDTVLVILPS